MMRKMTTWSWKCVQQRNSEFSKWSDTIDSTENVEMERQHQRRLVHYKVVVQSCMNCTP